MASSTKAIVETFGQDGQQNYEIETRCISKPYEIKVSKELGRYLVATRDIQPLEVIIIEKPIVSGPSDNGCNQDSDLPKCLGCCSQLKEELRYSRCSKCYWPVCSEECAKLPNHAENECIYFSTHLIKYPPPNIKSVLNKCILILRMLLFKYQNGQLSLWNRIMEMESNTELRKIKPNSIAIDEKILVNFEKFNHGKWANDTSCSSFLDSATTTIADKNNNNKSVIFSKEEVIKLSGIIDTNAHVLPQKLSSETTCQIFPESSLLSHDCCANAEWSLQHSEGLFNCESLIHLTTRATCFIPNGSIINVCYDDGEIMYGTLRRLIPLEIGGLFICQCKRCIDPTELDTNFSSIKCPQCTFGYLLAENPINSFSDWKCNKCTFKVTDEQILELLQDLEEEIDFPKKIVTATSKSSSSSSNEDLRKLEKYLVKYSGRILHKNHYILQELRLRIIAEESAILEKLNMKRLQRFIKRCEHNLNIANILSPGLSEYRTIVEFHLARGLLMMQRVKEAAAGKKSTKQRQEQELTDNSKDIIIYKRIKQLQEETLAYFVAGNNKWSQVLEQDLVFVKNWLAKHE